MKKQFEDFIHRRVEQAKEHEVEEILAVFREKKFEKVALFKAADTTIKKLGFEFTPKHPQEELEKCGADYKANHKLIDPLATITVIDEEKRFVTGQNQNASHETAQLMLETLNQKQ